MDLSTIQYDRSSVEEGKWFDGLPDLGDIELKVRGNSCELATEFRTKAIKNLPAKMKNRDGTIKDEAAEKIAIDVLVEVILLDWKNVSFGKDVPYSKEKAREFLENPLLHKFKNGVSLAAIWADEGDLVDKETLSGNSSKPSTSS